MKTLVIGQIIGIMQGKIAGESVNDLPVVCKVCWAVILDVQMKIW